ncbi:carbohydrate ABC transporter permease [Streptomyces sp. NPDC001380]|uniref:carbohydrate ABC transporter permease n=1 Tax=Streptomyces sp. NPDC001380 TaxID=3364566 RepID=UPI0036992809
MSSTRSGRDRRRPGLVWLFPLPALALSGFLFLYPVLQSFRYALTDWDGYSASYRDVGPANLVRLATGDDLFHHAAANTFRLTAAVVLVQTALALLLALLLVRTTPMSVLLRALFFLPAVLSSVSVAFVWRFVYEPGGGLLDTALRAVGLGGVQPLYLGDPGHAVLWLALTQVWFHAGQMTVVFVAGLQAIPREYHEAAALDGAGRLARFRHVTWPLLAPAAAIVAAYTTVQSFKAFDLVLGLGGNPPGPGLDLLSTRIYTTFSDDRFGYAAAESLVFMAFVLLLTWVQRRALGGGQP